jgi:hypothetical protein
MSAARLPISDHRVLALKLISFLFDPLHELPEPLIAPDVLEKSVELVHQGICVILSLRSEKTVEQAVHEQNSLEEVPIPVIN